MIARSYDAGKQRLCSSEAILRHDANRLEIAAMEAGRSYEALRQELFALAKEIRKAETGMFGIHQPAADDACERFSELSRQRQELADRLPEVEAKLANLRHAAYAAQKLVDLFPGFPDELKPQRGLAGAAVAGTF